MVCLKETSCLRSCVERPHVTPTCLHVMFAFCICMSYLHVMSWRLRVIFSCDICTRPHVRSTRHVCASCHVMCGGGICSEKGMCAILRFFFVLYTHHCLTANTCHYLYITRTCASIHLHSCYVYISPSLHIPLTSNALHYNYLSLFVYNANEGKYLRTFPFRCKYLLQMPLPL